LSKAGMASLTGQCSTFSDNADGYVRGEGCGVVIIKDLDQVG
jgi:acyl transferase domain-containing protein